MKRARATVTLQAVGPDYVVPHGTVIRHISGQMLGVVWPWWRRVLYAVGLRRFAPRSDKSGKLHLTVEEV